VGSCPKTNSYSIYTHSLAFSLSCFLSLFCRQTIPGGKLIRRRTTASYTHTYSLSFSLSLLSFSQKTHPRREADPKTNNCFIHTHTHFLCVRVFSSFSRERERERARESERERKRERESVCVCVCDTQTPSRRKTIPVGKLMQSRTTVAYTHKPPVSLSQKDDFRWKAHPKTNNCSNRFSGTSISTTPHKSLKSAIISPRILRYVSNRT